MIRSLICMLLISASTVFAGSFSFDKNPHHSSHISTDLPVLSVTGESIFQECTPINVTFTPVPPTCFMSGRDGKLIISAITGGGNTDTYQVTVVGVATQTFTGTPIEFTGLTTTNPYTVQVTDAEGCFLSFQVFIPAPFIRITATVQPTCSGQTNGSITINNISGGSGNYTIYIDNGTPQTVTGFPIVFPNLAAGPHRVIVTDVSTGCQNDLRATVGMRAAVVIQSTTTPTCSSANTGTITITNITGGTGTYNVNVDGGPSKIFSGTSIQFSGLAGGTHIVTATDTTTGCVGTAQVTVETRASIIIDATTEPSCSGDTNGTITVNTISGGTGIYNVSVDGGPTQTFSGASIEFTNIAPGTHTVTAVDTTTGCVGTVQVTVGSFAPIQVEFIVSPPTCFNGDNGSLTILSISGGAGGYQVTLNGVPLPPSGTFEGLPAGIYQLTVTDSALCTVTIPVTVQNAARIEAEVTTSPTCPSMNTGTITVSNITGGTGNYNVRIGGGPSQPYMGLPLVFTNVPAGAQPVIVTDIPFGCEAVFPAVVETRASIIIDATQESSCSGGPNGTITVNAISGGTGTYNVSVDGGPTQIFSGSPIQFFNIAPGAHTVTAVDTTTGCVGTAQVTVGTTEPLQVTFTVVRTCPTVAQGKICVTSVSGGTAPYLVNIDGGASQLFTGSTLVFANLAVGEHFITVIDSKGCTSTTRAVVCPSRTKRCKKSSRRKTAEALALLMAQPQ
ncbi:SprB repeat-containing protein [Candidatus Dependentiae bacterium]|nr:SprB repeat-containing protein [Candidatus Dependentiae bacterium]